MPLEADRALALSHLAVSHETAVRLDIYVDLLLRWQTIKNLVAPSTLEHVWTRHLADSAQLLPLLDGAHTVVDFGSGAGFPGLVLAIAGVDRPGFHVHLVESNGRKASFLREVARATEAPATVHAMRIEDFTAAWRGNADIVTARALAPVGDLLDLGEKLFRAGARGLFLKGRGADQELTDAGKYWRIDAQLLPSVTDPTGRIMVVSKAARRSGP
ncbi:16S rRNA (guanine(527)-N(7))-methyltransferase RsmG [Labrys monachus]|uniref:Ribosomal RNA small subunit methyltransferase G n=1 Tax=Labrys monachus TaxID=217067 RepID=A0ABU0FNX2_9HYPH|nr:16S rRNA (guanine(527)-N(7))-methyltransferase RsmG [Labrys monachus]MDQ0396062.1 16S rRNA (guanine527-N7)-methyltransferase [Labrys monachus]